jgi:hypothetical protein
VIISRAILLIGLAVVSISQPMAEPVQAAWLYGRGWTFDHFINSVHAQRDVWARVTSAADVPEDLVDRFSLVNTDLRLLIVAEDWCTDSVNTVPYIAALARRSGTELRIIGRSAGAPVMRRHPASDGRAVTPVVVMIRGRVEAAAWVERPAVLQSLFKSIGSNPANAAQFAERQAWYERDRGRSTLSEVVQVAERLAAGK